MIPESGWRVESEGEGEGEGAGGAGRCHTGQGPIVAIRDFTLSALISGKPLKTIKQGWRVGSLIRFSL